MEADDFGSMDPVVLVLQQQTKGPSLYFWETDTHIKTITEYFQKNKCKLTVNINLTSTDVNNKTVVRQNNF